MTRTSRIRAGRPASFLGPLVVALVAWMAAQSAAQAPADEAAAAQALAEQKAAMLEMFLRSPRMDAARAADPEAAEALIAEARAKLEESRSLLAEGHPMAAMEALDHGIAIVARAAALAARRNDTAGTGGGAGQIAERRRQIESLVAAINSGGDLPPQARAELEALRGRLERAEEELAQGRVERARAQVEAAYADVVDLVGDLRRGQKVFVARTFETAQEAWEYERERHRSYLLLVELALAERPGSAEGLRAFARRLLDEAEQLRAEAEQQAAWGDYPDAIRKMEQATGRLLAVLRAAGVMVME